MATIQNPLSRAEGVLAQLDPGLFTTDADSIAYARALIELAEARRGGIQWSGGER